MESRNLYSFIASAALLFLAVTAWASQDPFEGVPVWGYVSAGLGILLFAYAMWSSRVGLRGGLRLRSTRTGIQVVLMSLIVAAILVVAGLFSVKHYQRWDLTPGKFFSLSAKTRQLLRRLDREKRRVEFLAFTRKLERPAVEEILSQYAHFSDQVSYRFVDLDAAPRTAKKYDVDAYGTIVVVHRFGPGEGGADGGKEKGKEKKAASSKESPKQQSPKPKGGKRFRSEKIYSLSENAVANAILKTIQTEQKRVYFLTGHGERSFTGRARDTLSTLATGMRDDNYRVEDLLLLRKKGVPEDAKILVVAAPRKDITEAEAGFIEDFLRRGGRLLVLLEPDTPSGRLTALLKKFGFETPPSFIIDPQAVRFALAGGNEITPFVADYGVHRITAQLKGLATVFPTSRRVAVKGDPKRGLSAETLARTGPGSFWVSRVSVQNGQLSYDPKDRKNGPVPLAAAVTVSLERFTAGAGKGKEGKKEAKKEAAEGKRAKEARLVVFGDADFASDAFVGAQGNANLIFNAVNWLGGERDLISIRPKRRVGEPLVLGQGEGTFVRLLTVWLMPMFIILAGAAVYVRRRRLR